MLLTKKAAAKEQIICSVDLGTQYRCSLHHYAVRWNCPGKKVYQSSSVKRPDVPCAGTDKQVPAEHGSVQVKSRWAYAKRLNTELGRKIAGAVTGYAEENHADVIVFEYLEIKGKISGRKKQKLHLWRKRISRKDVNIRHTGKECGYPGSVRGIPAGLHMMGQEQLSVIRKITAFVHSRQEKI